MAILNRIFEKGDTEDVTKSLGNILVSGVEHAGSIKLYFNMLATALREKKTLLLLNGGASNDQHSKLLMMVKPHMVGRKLYDFHYGPESSTVNILTAFPDAEQKAEFLMQLLATLCAMPDSLKDRAQRFYLYAMTALDSLGIGYTLKDLSMMDVDYVTEKVEAAPLPELEKGRALRFLKDSSMYSAFLDIETQLVKLETGGLLQLLSGTAAMAQVLNQGNVVMVSGLLRDDSVKKQQLVNILLYAMEKYLEREKADDRVLILARDTDFIAGDFLKVALEYNQSYHFATYLFVEDITGFIRKNGNDVLDKVKTYLVLTQLSDENATFWSNFFGSRDVNERNYSFTKRRGLNPFATMYDGGVVSTPRRYSSVTYGFHKVNKPIHRPEVFRELRPQEVMCYLSDPLMRRKARIEE